MTRDVLVRISGIQQMEEDRGDVEMITRGDYFLKNGKHYVIYNEVMDGIDGNIRNTVKITPDQLDIRRQGAIGAHLVFSKNSKSSTRYETPMGEMVVEVSTNDIALKQQEDSLQVQVDYSLDINYQHISDCRIVLDVCSAEKAQLSL